MGRPADGVGASRIMLIPRKFLVDPRPVSLVEPSNSITCSRGRENVGRGQDDSVPKPGREAIFVEQTANIDRELLAENLP
jgi:hypothetical protein